VLGLVAAILAASVGACGSATDRAPVTPSAGPSAADALPSAVPSPSATPALTPAPTPRPAPGHEMYGFVPYWEMDSGIAAHLRQTKLTTLALFSVTTTATGAIDTSAAGHGRITGNLGRQLIREAHQRGARVELVFSSFGFARNRSLFSDVTRQDRTIASLVALAGKLGVDGIDVDVELLDLQLASAYGAFVGRLRAAVVAADAKHRVTVATTGTVTGAVMAAAAADAGADRVFLMGYDYHWPDSEPGASSPIHRHGEGLDLTESLDIYEAVGVPVQRTLLGLPLYGMSWPVAGPSIGDPSTGSGTSWILDQHLDVLRDRALVPQRDELEMVELYTFRASGGGWRAVYVDSPTTLAAKLAIANERGLAGAGFWAIGYERGLPAYTALIAAFAAGKPMQ
jgi:spore germination protein YaaH